MSSFALIVLGLVSAQAPTQPSPSGAMMLAQAHDRCMTTYAVRFSKTETDDEVIYTAASENCREIEGQLQAAIAGEYPPDQAKQLTGMMAAQAKPNFLNMLHKIRADRKLRAPN